MANLAARDTIFNDLFDFRRDLNGIFNRLVTGSQSGSERPARILDAVPPIEAWVDKDEKKYHLSIALAGENPKDIELNLQGNNLTVSGEQKVSEEKEDAAFVYQEFAYGRFERASTLPEWGGTS